MSQTLKSAFSLLAWLCLAQMALAQGAGFSLGQFDVEDGLSQSHVNCLEVDGRGFVWVGTQDGLNKFDGYEFVKYRYSPGDSASISSNNIQDICVSANGEDLWLATDAGLNRFDRRTGKFTRWFASDPDDASLPDDNVLSVLEDSQGLVWVVCYPSRVARLDPGTGRFERLSFTPKALSLGTNPGDFALLEDRQGVMLVGTDNGLCWWDAPSGALQQRHHFAREANSIDSDLVLSLFEDSDGNLWVGTDRGLNLFNSLTKVFERMGPEGGLQIRGIAEDLDKRLWLATDKGLVLFDLRERVFIDAGELGGDLPERLPAELACVKLDHSGILWLGSLADGLFNLKLQSQVFRLHGPNNPLPGFTDYDASSFLPEEGALWVGTAKGGLYRWRTADGQVERFGPEDAGLPEARLNTLFRDGQGRLWLGLSRGMGIFDLATRRFVSYGEMAGPNSNSDLQHAQVFAFEEDPLGRLWVATSFGVFILSESGVAVLKAPAHLPDDRVFDMALDDKGQVWLATAEGLVRLAAPGQEPKIYRLKGPNDANGLSHQKVLCLHFDSEQYLWVGTQSGLNRLDLSNDNIDFFNERDGMASDFIHAIEEDASGRLWLSTNRGILSFDKLSHKVLNFDPFHGLQGYEFNLGASALDSSGMMFFGGPNGFNSFLPDSVRPSDKATRVSLTGYQIISEEGNRRVHADRMDTLVLETKTDLMFTIFFSALEFTRPEQNLYRCKMEGGDEDWRELGRLNMAIYPILPPGTYAFLVESANSDGVWSPERVRLVVVSKAHFWNSGWTILAGILLALLMVAGVIWLISGKARETQRALVEKNKANEIARLKNEELAISNKQLTESIQYSKRIIDGMMPSERTFMQILPNAFVLYRPKDIVSGDFYWLIERNGKTLLAAVDCTGHGVPGALMSIIGYDLLKNIVIKQGIEKPAEVLNLLNHGISETFDGSDTTGDAVKDGMDLAFLSFDWQSGTVEYAGAFNPLYLIRDNSLVEVKANRFSVGYLSYKQAKKFDNHSLSLQKGDMLYIFSDGYADQFGGAEGKKFKFRRFRHLLLNIHTLPLHAQREQLDKTVESWRGHREQVDDILVIGIRYQPRA